MAGVHTNKFRTEKKTLPPSSLRTKTRGNQHTLKIRRRTFQERQDFEIGQWRFPRRRLCWLRKFIFPKQIVSAIDYRFNLHRFPSHMC